jgi:hypothetical protein
MRSKVDEEDETCLDFPTILLDDNRNPASFRPVAQLEAELETFCRSAQGRRLTFRLAATGNRAEIGGDDLQI